jgi:predicted RNA-binding protein YlqC (UPF0109 family)
MDLVPVTEFLVKSIVKDTDMVSVKQYDDEDLITIDVLVASDDMPSLIGKQGSVASAIRTMVIAASFKEETRKKIKINFDSF